MGLIFLYLLVAFLVGGFAFVWDFHISQGTRDERIEEALEYVPIHFIIGLFWFLTVPFIIAAVLFWQLGKLIGAVFQSRDDG